MHRTRSDRFLNSRYHDDADFDERQERLRSKRAKLRDAGFEPEEELAPGTRIDWRALIDELREQPGH